jgi:hypothetical protein
VRLGPEARATISANKLLTILLVIPALRRWRKPSHNTYAVEPFCCICGFQVWLDRSEEAKARAPRTAQAFSHHRGDLGKMVVSDMLFLGQVDGAPLVVMLSMQILITEAQRPMLTGVAKGG